jgi:hypothetical protein
VGIPLAFKIRAVAEEKWPQNPFLFLKRNSSRLILFPGVSE